MLSFAGVVGLRRETELPDTDFVFAFVPELVTNGQDMARAQLKVHPRNKIRPRLRIEYRLAEWNRGKSRIEQIEHDGIDDGGVLHVPAKPVKKEGSLLAQRAADVGVLIREVVGKLKSELLPSAKSWPWSFEEPGLVVTSMRP